MFQSHHRQCFLWSKCMDSTACAFSSNKAEWWVCQNVHTKCFPCDACEVLGHIVAALVCGSFEKISVQSLSEPDVTISAALCMPCTDCGFSAGVHMQQPKPCLNGWHGTMIQLTGESTVTHVSGEMQMSLSNLMSYVHFNLVNADSASPILSTERWISAMFVRKKWLNLSTGFWFWMFLLKRMPFPVFASSPHHQTSDLQLAVKFEAAATAERKRLQLPIILSKS